MGSQHQNSISRNASISWKSKNRPTNGCHPLTTPLKLSENPLSASTSRPKYQFSTRFQAKSLKFPRHNTTISRKQRKRYLATICKRINLLECYQKHNIWVIRLQGQAFTSKLIWKESSIVHPNTHYQKFPDGSQIKSQKSLTRALTQAHFSRFPVRLDWQSPRT